MSKGPSVIQSKADAFCMAMGLDTTEKRIQYCRQQAKLLGRKKTVREMREWMENPRSSIAARYAEEYRLRKKSSL